MNLAADVWYVRWFFWSCRALNQFCLTSDYRYSRYYNRERIHQNGTNLCHFFRTLLWGSLLGVLSVATWIYVGFVVIVMPFLLVGTSNIGIVFLAIGTVVGVPVAAVALLYGISVGLSFGLSFAIEKVRCRPAKENTVPSFFGLTVSYLAALKQRMCPIIKFTKDDTHA